MWAVLSGVANCEAYVDDVVVYSPDWESYMNTLLTVFQRFENASQTLSLSK